MQQVHRTQKWMWFQWEFYVLHNIFIYPYDERNRKKNENEQIIDFMHRTAVFMDWNEKSYKWLKKTQTQVTYPTKFYSFIHILHKFNVHERLQPLSKIKSVRFIPWTSASQFRSPTSPTSKSREDFWILQEREIGWERMESGPEVEETPNLISEWPPSLVDRAFLPQNHPDL